ncbi:glutamate--tRNA ligase [Hwanghaeella sp.]|uniref:glutamate--tRNA ligase n=1 Tax=Hwanghaeella sp. TaxID=2605943 RepID=UPI003CCBE0F2
MSVVTRFAPSPTGFLHIGGARTALFNWLYARHHGGKYLLRIEDTDRARSTQEAIDAILDGLNWLGLMPDGDVVYQSRNATRHADVAKSLLAEGKAYYCYCSPEELAEMREKAKAEGRPMRYDGTWRDRDPAEAPAGVDPVIRLKMPQDGETTIHDQVQGEVTIGNSQLDDMILLRSDGTPTYMLSVVVDDHDMGVTHVIRGDDHLTNAFRQYQLFVACGWDVPSFAHIPLIHGPDGAKLSKRHGALGVDAYREMGYLPEAINNYLLRLGWAHGDEEIISQEKAVEWFDLPAVGKSASRFDFAKLENLNGHYIRHADDARLAALAAAAIGNVDESGLALLTAGMPGLKERAKTVAQLAESAGFYLRRPTFPLEIPKAAKLLSGDAPALLAEVADFLETYQDWAEDSLQEALRAWAEERELGLGKIAQPLRAALTGSNISPSIFEIMVVLGKEESLARIRAAAAQS